MKKYSCTIEQLDEGLDHEAAALGPVARRRLWWVSEDGQASLDMGSWPADADHEEIERKAWTLLREQGHDMSGSLVWAPTTDGNER